MAAVADVKLVNITVNNIELQVPQGELIVESVKRLGLDIPIFCYHPRMKPVGMCRMCLVETGMKQPDGTVRRMPKPQAACTMPASEGLVIYTDSAMVHKDRKGVLEFLLINHPLDCPVCDRGGECPLQNNTLFYGPSTSRYVEMKRHAHKAYPLSKYVTLDLERCIQCGRCVRFTEEISGDSMLAFRFRGANMQPSTFGLLDFESKFSGNTIEICPVGALTNRKYRFRARPWDLETRPGICTGCSNGCNIFVDYRNEKVVRFNGRTNESVNEEWTCDKGKFGFEPLNSEDRLTVPLIRDGNTLVETEWAGVYAQLLTAFSQKGDRVAALVGTTQSNEDLYLLKRLFNRDFGSFHVDFRFEAELSTGSTVSNSTLTEIEKAPAILVFGTALADDEPIAFLRVRKAWFKHKAKVFVAHSEGTDVDGFANSVIRFLPGKADVVAQALLAKLGKGGSVSEDFESETGVRLSDITSLAESLLPGSIIITSRNLYNLPGGASAAEALSATGFSFNCYALGANEEGAVRLGLHDRLDGSYNTHQILEAAASGKISALWLAGVDPFVAHPDRDLVIRALENVEFLVVQGTAKTEAFHYASVVLPMCAPVESDGSYTNLEGRVQRFAQVLEPKGLAKAPWRIYSELSMRLKPATPYFNPGEVMDRISADVPAFAGCNYAALEGDGQLLP